LPVASCKWRAATNERSSGPANWQPRNSQLAKLGAQQPAGRSSTAKVRQCRPSAHSAARSHTVTESGPSWRGAHAQSGGAATGEIFCQIIASLKPTRRPIATAANSSNGQPELLPLSARSARLARLAPTSQQLLLAPWDFSRRRRQFDASPFAHSSRPSEQVAAPKVVP